MVTMTKEHTFVVSGAAQETITAINEQVQAVIDQWHYCDLETALKCAASGTKILAQLLTHTFGDRSEVSRDGELSLLVCSGLTYGLIAHPIGFPGDMPTEDTPRTRSGPGATWMGQYCLSQHHTPQPIYRGEQQCSCEFPEVYALPVPIEWSFHS